MDSSGTTLDKLTLYWHLPKTLSDLVYFPICVRFVPPKTRLERIATLESMLDVSSNALTAMASQLSEAEEREHSLHTKTRWNSIKSMTDAKCLLQYVFNSTAEAR